MTQYILYFRKPLVFGDYSKNVCQNPMKDSFIFMVSFKNYCFGFCCKIVALKLKLINNCDCWSLIFVNSHLDF